MKCKDCKYYIEYRNEDYGTCRSDKWNIHPDFYHDSEKVTEKDMVEVTYQPKMGKDFGCIHYEISSYKIHTLHYKV